MARQTRGLVHLKTAGTSYLEALRTVAAAGLLWLLLLIFAPRYLYIYPVGIVVCAAAGFINGLGSMLFYGGLHQLDASLAEPIVLNPPERFEFKAPQFVYYMKRQLDALLAPGAGAVGEHQSVAGFALGCDLAAGVHGPPPRALDGEHGGAAHENSDWQICSFHASLTRCARVKDEGAPVVPRPSSVLLYPCLSVS